MLDCFQISRHLPVSVTLDLPPRCLPTLPLEDSFGFVEWSREDCIVGAGLDEHTFFCFCFYFFTPNTPFFVESQIKYIHTISFWAQNLDLSGRAHVLQGSSVSFWKSVEVKWHRPSVHLGTICKKQILSGVIIQLSWIGNQVGGKYRNFQGDGRGGEGKSQPFV